VARPTYNLHQCLNITDSEPTNGKLYCENQQHASIHQLTQHDLAMSLQYSHCSTVTAG